MKSNATRALLCALVLCCVPALASIPPAVQIRIGGAELIDDYHYLVTEKSAVSVAVKAKPGDLIWLYAVALDKTGEPDNSAVVSLLLDKTETGLLSGDFMVPAGLEGLSFQLAALAVDQMGNISHSTTIIVDVASSEKQPQKSEAPKEPFLPEDP